MSWPIGGESRVKQQQQLKSQLLITMSGKAFHILGIALSIKIFHIYFGIIKYIGFYLKGKC